MKFNFDYVMVTIVVIGVMFFAAVTILAPKAPLAEPLVCPPRITDAQMAIINRRADTVICTYDGGVFVNEEITPRRR